MKGKQKKQLKVYIAIIEILHDNRWDKDQRVIGVRTTRKAALTLAARVAQRHNNAVGYTLKFSVPEVKTAIYGSVTLLDLENVNKKQNRKKKKISEFNINQNKKVKIDEYRIDSKYIQLCNGVEVS